MANSLISTAFSWESFGDLLKSGYDNLNLPSSDNESVIYDLIYYHASTDPLIFALRMALFFSFCCWFMSMATGTHSWVQIDAAAVVVRVRLFVASCSPRSTLDSLGG